MGIEGVIYWDNGKENGNYYIGVIPKPLLRRATEMGLGLRGLG